MKKLFVILAWLVCWTIEGDEWKRKRFISLPWRLFKIFWQMVWAWFESDIHGNDAHSSSSVVHLVSFRSGEKWNYKLKESNQRSSDVRLSSDAFLSYEDEEVQLPWQPLDDWEPSQIIWLTVQIFSTLLLVQLRLRGRAVNQILGIDGLIPNFSCHVEVFLGKTLNPQLVPPVGLTQLQSSCCMNVCVCVDEMQRMKVWSLLFK